MFAFMGNSVSNFVAEQRLSAAKRKLQSKLATLISLMDGHKAAGLGAGNRLYVILEDRAMAAIKEFQDVCATPVPTYDEIAAGAPKLLELKSLASGADGKASMPIIVASGVIVSGVLLTGILALCHDMYLLMTHYANIHWMVR